LILKWDNKGTLRVINKILKINPNNIRALLTKANFIRDMPNKIKKARELVTKALTLEPDNTKILTMLAEMTLHPKDIQANLRAMKLIDKALDINPQLDGAWDVKGLIFYHLKDMEEAERCFIEAVKFNSNNRRAKDNLAGVRDILARTNRKRVKVSKGISTLKKDYPRGKIITDEEISVLFEKAHNLTRMYQNKEALKFIKKILEVDPNHIDAMLLKAEIYKRMLKSDKAIKLVRKTLLLKPNYSKSFVLLAALIMSPKDSKANMIAMKLVDKALKGDSQSDDAWALKGLLYSRFNDKENTKRCYEKALRINPNNSRARGLIGRYQTLKEEKEFFKEIDQRPEGVRGITLNFGNPKIRAEKFAKQLGFDPVAFAPLDQDNMVYVHLDGNDKNDDPETHAWVSKETYERLKSGTLFKGQKSEIGHQRKLIEQHLETHLGGVNKILHDQRKDKFHIDIYVLPPNDKRKYGIMATSGMSDYPMNCPPNLKLFQFGELYVKLPPDWPYPMEVLEQDDNAWVIQNLYLLPRSVHNNRTFFWNGQVIDNDEPFARNTKLSGFLIKYPSTIDIPVEFNMLKVNPQKAICFFQLIPLYNEEMDFLEKHGLEKLYEKFDEYKVTDIVDLKRPNVC